jgi:hypothetical protein
MADLSGDGSGGPAVYAFAITPHNDNDLAFVTRAIWVGGAGAVEVITSGGDTVVLAGITAGTLLPVRAKRVRAAGTTVTNGLLIGLY